MQLEETIMLMQKHYGSIFPTRGHCLNHLFFVGGNGYEWQDGELVDVCDSYSEETLNRLQETERRLVGSVTHSDFRKKYVDNITWYPISRFLSILNFPQDIKADWLAGMIETVDLILADDNADLDYKNVLRKASVFVRSKAIKIYQARDDMHPLTCGNEHVGGHVELGPMIVDDRVMLHCPNIDCDYIQVITSELWGMIYSTLTIPDNRFIFKSDDSEDASMESTRSWVESLHEERNRPKPKQGQSASRKKKSVVVK